MLASLVAPLLFALVGVLMYALASNAKLAEIGRLVFFVGIFWVTYALLGRVVHV